MLFAVQPLVQDEFHLSKVQIGYLTSAFLGFYMIAAPFVGPLADRYSRKLIIVLGAIFWSGLTLLTALTHTYTRTADSAHPGRHWRSDVRHHRADLCGGSIRGGNARTHPGRVLSRDSGGIGGRLPTGRQLAPHYGWRFPFYIAAAPGFLLAIAVLFLRNRSGGNSTPSGDSGARDNLRSSAQSRRS